MMAYFSRTLRSLDGALKTFETKRPFTEREAWNLFRIAALAEACGWTLLIAGILVNRYHLPGQTIAIPIAGQIHGTIFLAYFGVLIATYASLQWPRRTAILAALAGVPPYGTLVFEQFAARSRKKKARAVEQRVVARAIITNGQTVLACQPAENTLWVLPGADVPGGESPQKTLTSKVSALTGITPKLGSLRYVAQTKQHGRDQLELYFAVNNSADFASLNLEKIAKQSEENDDVRFVSPQTAEDLHPPFLRGEAEGRLFGEAQAAVGFY